ncbi:MAG: hypothetical protein GEV00_03605 [Actinophytocola sp.]|nr:hypothetical protein [Actinophytocola sp.]
MFESLARVAAVTDSQRAQASEALRAAVGRAADDGLTQAEIATAIGRSQPEVSRLIRIYRARRFRPRSPLGALLHQYREQIVALAQAHKATNVRVFGSVLRGEDGEDSDVDLLVDLEPGADLMDLVSLDADLAALLKRRVDVVPARMLRPHVAPAALADAEPL